MSMERHTRSGNSEKISLLNLMNHHLRLIYCLVVCLFFFLLTTLTWLIPSFLLRELWLQFCLTCCEARTILDRFALQVFWFHSSRRGRYGRSWAFSCPLTMSWLAACVQLFDFGPMNKLNFTTQVRQRRAFDIKALYAGSWKVSSCWCWILGSTKAVPVGVITGSFSRFRLAEYISQIDVRTAGAQWWGCHSSLGLKHFSRSLLVQGSRTSSSRTGNGLALWQGHVRSSLRVLL